MGSGKKRVLVFIDWFLPGDKAGGPVRSCANLVDHLGGEFDFSIVTRDTDYTETIPYPTVKSNSWNTLPDGKRVYYISAEQLKKETIARLLREETYDAVYLNGIWSQPFTAWPLQEFKKRKDVRVVVAVRGMLAPAAMAIKATKKKAFLAYAKLRGLFSNVIFHATNETEAAETKGVFGNNAQVRVAGNLPRKAGNEHQPHAKTAGTLRIVNVARIAPEKNTLYAIEALTNVTVPVQVDFYGTVYNEEYFSQCKIAVEKLPANVSLTFHPAVNSNEILKLLSSYDLLFLPTRGENFGHVILEAMQAGLPVLISDKTPWKNLASENAGWELPLDHPETFAKKIEEVAAMSEENYKTWSEGALKLSTKYAENPQLLEVNRKLFADVISTSAH